MGNGARKIIEAVQNSLLDRLLFRSFPLFWTLWMWGELQPERDLPFQAPFLLGFIVLFGLAWLLGAAADRRPRSRNPYDRAHDRSPDAFDAWEEQPRAGLRPPGFMRALVTILGAGRSSHWLTFLTSLLFLAVLAFTPALVWIPDAVWGDVHPALSDSLARADLMGIIAIAMAILLVRIWAVEQRGRLDPTPARAGPAWMGWIVSMAFLAIVLSPLAFLPGLPVWSGPAAALAISLILTVSRWAGRVLDILFGKREDPAA